MDEVRETMGEARRVRRWWDAVAPVRAALSRPPEADLTIPVTRDVAAAEWRWHFSNEQARAQGCPCGGPAQVSKAHQVTGTVPFLWWTCEDHAGAGAFTSYTADGVTTATALYSHTQPCPFGEDCGSGGPIGGPSDHFFCTHRTHAESDR
jgi:hypothetical protein